LFSDEVGYRRGASNSSVSSGFWSRCTVNSTNDTLGSESFQQGGGVHAKKASNWNTAIGDENFLSGAGAIDPFAEVGSQVAHSDVHPFSVQHDSIHLYISSMFWVRAIPQNIPHTGLTAHDRTD
jgi:hypothetical protein